MSVLDTSLPLTAIKIIVHQDINTHQHIKEAMWRKLILSSPHRPTAQLKKKAIN